MHGLTGYKSITNTNFGKQSSEQLQAADLHPALLLFTRLQLEAITTPLRVPRWNRRTDSVPALMHIERLWWNRDDMDPMTIRDRERFASGH
jgi:hypothetical protein